MSRRQVNRAGRLETIQGWIGFIVVFLVIGTATHVKAQANLDTFTYSYSNLFNGELQRQPGFTEFDMVLAVEEAFSLWSQYAPLSFVELPDSGPLPDAHDDPYPNATHPQIRIGHHAFDDNTLGHAFLFIGVRGLNGDVHLDSSNREWSEQLFLTTVTHELGHSIGLDHLDDQGPSVMNTRIGPENMLSGIGRGFLFPPEIAGIQELWGVGRGTVTTTRIWTGTQSSNWSGHQNWDRGWRPTKNANVFLQTDGGVQIRSADQAARSITLGGGRNQLRVTAGGSIDVGTDVTLGTRHGGASFVAEGATVRALVPQDANLQNVWHQPGFDDADWIVGPTGVGFERSAGFETFIGTDVETQMYDRNASVYARIEFETLDISELDFLTLRMRYDDGFVAFLNGVEVAASNAPNRLRWNSQATAIRSDNEAIEFQEFDISSGIDLLNAGTNVLAIHGLNSQVGSSDMLLSPTLHGGTLDHTLIVDEGTMNINGNLAMGIDSRSTTRVTISGGSLHVRGNVTTGLGTSQIDLQGGVLRVGGGDPGTLAVNANSASRTHVPAGDDLANAWTSVGFDDSSWQVGTASLGYERNVGFDDLITTDLEADLFNVNGSVYARIEFDAADLSDVRQMTLSMRFDDGFVAYLNGHEVARANAPDSPRWNSTAVDSIDDEDVRTAAEFDLSSNIELLNEGRNVLAIHGLNHSTTSSDMLIVPELTLRDIGGTLSVGQLNLAGGNLLDVVTIDGKVNHTSGLFSPSEPGSDGRKPGHLTITRGYRMHEDAVLQVDLEGHQPDQHDTLDVQSAQLDGTLSIAVNENGGDYSEPQIPGQVGHVLFLTANAIEGTFSSVLFGGQPLDTENERGLFRTLVYTDHEISLRSYRAIVGDADGDGRFDSRDFVRVFQAGEYEDAIPENSGWTEGDWDGDLEFASGDIVLALKSGLYEIEPAAAQAVPEPASGCLTLLGLLSLLIRIPPRNR